ncbi:GNAT family N-acetyltransferase [bacterium]|nr:GNAT family N-acetyltransferase [bacterium]
MTAIREFLPGDYPGLVVLRNAVDPDHPVDEAELRHYDESRDRTLHLQRWVWEEAGRILGYATLSHMDWMYHPDRYYGMVQVLPSARGRGRGRALYETVLAAAQARGALSLRTQVLENWADGLRFLAARGYVPGNREVESALDLTRFAPERFAGAEAKTVAAGLRLLSYAELESDPERDRKLWDFDALVGADMPMPEPYTVPPFEVFQRKYLRHPDFYAEGFLVAVTPEGLFAGLSMLQHSKVPGRLNTGFTGVRREWRGQGVATGLKVAVLSRAKAAGYREVRTGNDSTNDSMLGINRRLGFTPLPAWVDFALEPLPAQAQRQEA